MPALKVADRVKETTTTTGTGTVDLAGIVNGVQCYSSIVHQSAAEWEVGIGTVTDASPDTLSRDTVLASSNSNAAVSLSAGTKNVFAVTPDDLAKRLTIMAGIHIPPLV